MEEGGGELAISSSSILGCLLGNYLGCVLNRASRLQKTSGHHPLMVRLQDFSINGLEESGHHSPLRESMFIKGEGVLKEVSLGKEGGGGDLATKRERHYGILE